MNLGLIYQFSFLFAWNAMKVDQARVNLLIYHKIIGTRSEYKHSLDLTKLLLELSTFLQIW